MGVRIIVPSAIDNPIAFLPDLSLGVWADFNIASVAAAYASGDPVPQWEPTEYDPLLVDGRWRLGLPSSSNAPTYVADAHQGVPAVRFSGANVRLGMGWRGAPDAPAENQFMHGGAVTTCALMRFNAPSAAEGPYVLGSGGGSDLTTNPLHDSTHGVTVDGAPSSIRFGGSIGDWIAISVVYDLATGEAAVYVNDAPPVRYSGLALAGYWSSLTLGARYYPVGGVSMADYNAVRVYSRGLDEDDVAEMHEVLRRRAGLGAWTFSAVTETSA